MGARALIPPTGDRPAAGDDDRSPEGRRLRARADRARERTRERTDQVRERTEHVRDRTRERTEQVRDRTRERTEQVRDRTRELTEPARMTVRRLFGIDRSGPPPPETLQGEPLRPWTIPNVVGMLRLACVPLFLVLALSSADGTRAIPAILFFLIAATDYLDGFLARLTGQYSRFGTLLDPITDRALVLAGGIVCWRFDLLPREALALLVARELYTVAGARKALREGVRMQVNWWGRLAVWPLMGGLFAALVGIGTPARVAVIVGVAMAVVASAKYTRDGRRALRERRLANAAVPDA